MRQWFGRLTLTWIVLGLSFACFAQQDQSTGMRKVVTRVVPEYPQLARSLKLGGVVKVEAVVAPNGTVKAVAIRGGPPILTNAAVDAVRKWTWIHVPYETKEPVEVTFSPNQ
jgi:TonB family protein